MNDRKLLKYSAILILAPLALAIFGGDRFRYPCQDPANWDKAECKKPLCEVTRTCPEQIFKQDAELVNPPAPPALRPPPQMGANCK